ncbi:hypothetical protein IMCC9480_1750 [Oxalobacteraceae bacterium IMCC9480]|nr:hypothetical protein IMCC9480_1750 [Oxalobacteraceae bacterium IMCC9480]NDP60575.1 DUF2894 domain-containing protein [Oxalobacteraceae bacterium]
MDDSGHGAATDPSADIDTRIAALRAAGAARFDAVGQHYLEALAKRAKTHQGHIRRLLDDKLSQALAIFTARFEQARSEAACLMAEALSAHPQQADALQRLFDEHDFKGLMRYEQQLKSGDGHGQLHGLVSQLEQHGSETAEAGGRAELKILRSARNTWSSLSAGRQVARALEQGPKNAGPINSHMLVLRSLALMRDVSPDYLNRFMMYAGTLLVLDHPGKDKPATARKSPPARNAKT